MLRGVWILSLAAVLIWPVSSTALAAEAALVMDLSGAGAFYAAGPQTGRPVHLMDFLEAGQEIELKAPTRLVLNYFASAQREDIVGSGRLTVGETGSQTEPGLKVTVSKAVELPSPSNLSQTETQQTATVALRDMKHTSTPVLTIGEKGAAVAPPRKKAYREALAAAESAGVQGIMVKSLFQTAVVSVEPVFRWAAVEGAEAYRIQIFDFQDDLHREALTGRPEWVYNGPRLEPGQRYRWRVQALAQGRKTAQGSGEFWILSRTEVTEFIKLIEQVRRGPGVNSTEGEVARALVCEKFRLYDEAAALVGRLLQQHPGNKNLEERLRNLDPSSGF